MSGLTIEVVNLDKVIGRLSSLGDEVIGAAHFAARQEAKREFPLTQERVPIASGELQKSGRVEEVDNEADEAVVAIAYGGPAGSGPDQSVDVDYAVVVHEDLEAHHPHGQAKYVESVVREELASGRAAERMAADIRHRLGLG